MKDLTLETLIAVFEEIFGRGMFWGMVGLAAVITLLFLWAVWRDGGIRSRRMLRSQLWFLPGAVAMVAFVLFVTHSHLTNIGGPIDWFMLLALGVWGGVGAVMWAYVLGALALGRAKA